MVLIHIISGALGLILGYVALFSIKGAPLHRKAGMLFVYTMLTMSFTGMLTSIFHGAAPSINVPASVITAYLVFTATTTVRPIPLRLGWINTCAMLIALVIGLTSLIFGIEAIALGGERNGFPPYPFFLFGLIGVLTGIYDIRKRSGEWQGRSRIMRHLWRMCFALFIAAQAFFLGQTQVLPEVLQTPVLLAFPILIVLITMFYWLWRIRFKQTKIHPVRVSIEESH
ncbi:MAG: hypothetical protein KTR29_20685 [Rhodothermaceae bacterium]|nr:hypothetical protein [Rhodothermaceae bacterium]